MRCQRPFKENQSAPASSAARRAAMAMADSSRMAMACAVRAAESNAFAGGAMLAARRAISPGASSLTVAM